MANQPKAYKKFVATAATATLVATAIVPVASAATSFKDVSKDYQDAVNYLVENGIAQGTTETTFGTSNNISRGDAAVMIANALKLNTATAKDAGFQDVNARVAGAVNAIVEAGIASGKTATSFAPADYITRQEMAKMLANAYDLTAKETANFKDVNSNWIGYVSALKEAGITLGKTETTFAPTANLTRGEFALFMFRAEGIDTTPAPPVNVNATKVSSVSASNLKEVVVEFDGLVDADSAEDVSNYSINNGVTIKSASLSKEGKAVTLTINGVFANQEEYLLDVKKVFAGDKTVSVDDFAFTPLDNTLPVVQEVVSLGTKAVKVVFNEPIKTANANNFKIDGKTFYGSVSLDGREAILTPYDTSTLTPGEYKFEVTGVVDFQDLKSLASEHKLVVVEDKVAPTIVEVSATLEKAVVTFSEDVDPDTVSAANVYYKSGDTKYRADSKKKIAGNKYEFEFNTNKLPAYETTLFVEEVKDYSGNKISETSVKIKAEVDQTRPEVKDVDLASDNKTITVEFSKALASTSNDPKYFTVTDKDGKVLGVKDVKWGSNNRVLIVELYDALPEGKNSLKVSGIKDATTLSNTILDSTHELVVGDTEGPGKPTISTNAENRTVVLTFDEKMDSTTLANRANYLVEFNGSYRTLPSNVEILLVQDGKGVLFTFPKQISGTDVVFGNNLTGIQVMGLKDAAGNLIEGYVQKLDITGTTEAGLAARYSSTVTEKAAATAKRTVKVKFDQAIAFASAADFTLSDGTVVSSVSYNNTDTVTLTTATDIHTSAPINVTVKANNSIRTASGSKALVGGTTTAVADLIAPEVKLGTNVTTLSVKNAGPNAVISLPFSENLVASSDTAALYANDLVVTRVSDGKVLTAQTDYTTQTASGDAATIEIIVKDAVGGDSKYTVAVKANAQYIKDAGTYGNKAAARAAITTVDSLDLAAVKAPTVSGTYKSGDASKIEENETLVFTFDDKLDAAVLVALQNEFNTQFGGSGYTIAVDNNGSQAFVTVTRTNATAVNITGVGNNGVITLTAGNVTDDAGNTPSSNLTVDIK
ncbi:S-layer homology domain-containing protein [Sporosarcina luteola]|uniref:S-layer homology domain-containing protein n=1 Tax=Sporosarcina luteola TaxID=582850 RepID=UPI0020425172|nr:S-layer homology domain-containing protein [Sporosarcina luteola]MCM3636534.1 S-layer homology domain-containing protein [Sporosarcina luteola]